MTNDKIEEEILKKSLEGVEYNNFIITRGHIQKAISLIKAEYEKEINKNNGEWNKIVSEKQKEINDLKEEVERRKLSGKNFDELIEDKAIQMTYPRAFEKGLRFFEEQTSKKVEELKKIIGKNALKRDWDYIKEIDEIFTPSEIQSPQREDERANPYASKPMSNKRGGNSPEEDLCENCGHRGWEHNKGNECCFEFGDLYCPCEEFIPKKEVKK